MGNEFYIFSTNHLQSAPAQTLKTVSQLNLIASNYSAASVPKHWGKEAESWREWVVQAHARSMRAAVQIRLWNLVSATLFLKLNDKMRRL